MNIELKNASLDALKKFYENNIINTLVNTIQNCNGHCNECTKSNNGTTECVVKDAPGIEKKYKDFIKKRYGEIAEVLK